MFFATEQALRLVFSNESRCSQHLDESHSFRAQMRHAWACLISVFCREVQ